MGQVGSTSTCMDDSGGPCRSLRIAHAYIFSGTWPSGGISPSSYRLFSGAGGAFAAATDMPASSSQGSAENDCSVPQFMLQCNSNRFLAAGLGGMLGISREAAGERRYPERAAMGQRHHQERTPWLGWKASSS